MAKSVDPDQTAPMEQFDMDFQSLQLSILTDITSFWNLINFLTYQPAKSHT